MSMTIMLSGSIAKQPETRTSKNGNEYTTATIRTGEGDDAVVASITAFGDLAGTLAGLGRGSPITVVGTGKIGTYEAKDGSGTRASLSITASRIVALVDHQAPPRHRTDSTRQTTGSQYRRADERQYQPAPAGFDDDRNSIPF